MPKNAYVLVGPATCDSTGFGRLVGSATDRRRQLPECGGARAGRLGDRATPSRAAGFRGPDGGGRGRLVDPGRLRARRPAGEVATGTAAGRERAPSEVREADRRRLFARRPRERRDVVAGRTPVDAAVAVFSRIAVDSRRASGRARIQYSGIPDRAYRRCFTVRSYGSDRSRSPRSAPPRRWASRKSCAAPLTPAMSGSGSE